MASQFPVAPPVITDDGDTSWLQPQQFPAAPPPQSSGYWLPSIIGGILNAAKSGATLPGDVATGKASMADPATQQRVGDMAGLVTLGAGALPAEENALNMGIKAYHGSPHSFDQFDMSKIGTGEGAQAYGHGLYFAERPETAETYKGVQGAASFNPMANVADKSIKAGHNPVDSLKVVFPKATDEEINSAIATAKNPPPGHMYQVDINADPDHFLDWDKPLSEQHPVVQDLARNADLSHLSPGNRSRRMFEAWRGEYTPPDGLVVPEPTGNDLHSLLTDYGNNRQNNEALTKTFVDAGIPGIKYLDQGSRGKGDGSRNYVVFNDALVKVLKKYGLAGLGGAAGAGAMMNQPQPGQAGQFPQAPPN